MRSVLGRIDPLGVALTLGGVALAAYALGFANGYGLRVLTVAGVYALAAIGYQLIFGLAGALSLAQGAFFGLGAYVGGMLALHTGWEFTLTAPIATAVPVLVALLAGLPVLRLETHYFALATLAVAQVMLLLVVNAPDLTGGANGLAGVPPVTVAGTHLSRGLPLAGFVWGLVALGAALAARLKAGRFGRVLELAREDPLVAGCLGLDVAAARLSAFALSAGFGGLAGALAVHTQRVVSPDVLEFPVMVTILTICVVGGRGSIAGAVAGALLLVHLPEWLRGLERAYLLLYGVGLLACIILAPKGLMGLLPVRRRRPPEIGVSTVPPPISTGSGVDALSVDGLTRAFGGVVAVDDVAFSLSLGTVTGLIGPNGSGKTTLVNLISAVERADRGRVLIMGEAAPPSSFRRARVGLARGFQTPALPPDMPVWEAVAAARLAPVRSADDVSLDRAGSEAMAVLERIGLMKEAASLCGALPMGVRRRVDLARALARAPRVLLLDEPAAGLSPGERAEMARIITEAAATGVAVLVVEHDMEFLLPLCDRVLCLDRGRLIHDGPAEGVREDPAVNAAYFGGAA